MPDAGSVWVDVLPDLKKFGPRLRAELKGHADKGLEVPVGLDVKAARTELAAFKKQLDTIGRRTPRVRVSADTRSALASLVGVSKAADRLDGRIINMRVATTGSGPVAPVAPRTTPTSGGGGRGGGGSQRPFTDISPAGVAAATTMLPPLVPAVGALAGGLGAVASGFTAAGVGAAAFTLAAVPAIRDATSATGELTAEQGIFRDSLGGLNAAWGRFRAQTDGAVLVAAAQGVDAANVGLSKLTPTTQRTAHALADLSDEARAAMDGPRWTSFFDFMSRQATPSTLIFGRTLGNLATGITGFAVSMEPLWNVVGPGLEDMSARFAEWGHDSSNFTDFIAWTIENGPVFTEMFGQFAETAIDVGTAIAPLGTIYAEGLTILAGAISAVAETAPWLIQVAVAAKTAQVAFGLFSRVNTGLIQPLRELPGHVREYATSLGGVNGNASAAAAGTNRLKGALSGVSGVLGGPLGIGITAVVAGLGILISKKQEATQAAKEYQSALEADAGIIGDNTRAQIANNLAEEGAVKLARDLKVDLGLVTDALMGNEDAHGQVSAALQEYIDAQDEAANSGARGEDQTARMSDKAHELKNILDGQNGAITEGIEGYTDAQEAMAALGVETDAEKDKQEGLNEALAEGAFQARDLKTALDELTGAHVGATEAEANFQASIDRVTESVATNGQTLDENTEAGRANLDVLGELRDTTNTNTEAVKLNDGSIAEQIQTQARGREEFIKAAEQMGATASEAEDLADEYLGIPSDVETAIRVAATGEWSVPYSSDTGAGTPVGNGLSFYAEGGPVYGAGTATSDSIPAMLSNGEFVEPTHVVNHYGAPFFEALRHKAIPKGALPGFAKGGRVSKGAGDTPWDVLTDHQGDVREEWNLLVNALLGQVGDSMGEQWKSAMAGPMGVVRLAEASIGRFPESNGNNRNDITSWFGMDGAPWCFAAGTLVQTDTGLTEIQDIAPGDTVRAPSGAVRRVSAVYHRRKPLLRVRILGTPDTLATADHPYMTERGWVKAGDLQRGDKVAKPIPTTGNVKVNDDFAHLVGLYIAEGYRGHRDRCVTLCVAHGEAEDVAALVKRAGYEPHVSAHRTCSLVSVYDHALYRLMGAAGPGAHRKEVPGFVYTWDEAGRRAFIEGYVSGDGHRPPSRPGVVACTTVSKRLTVSLAGLLSTLGISAAVRSTRPARVEVIQGRTVRCREQFVIEWREHPSRKAQHRFDGGVLWVPVRSITDTGVVDEVFDLQVDEEHAFIANGVHVHNCAMFISWLFAQTGTSAALGGAARTAWTGDYYKSGMAQTRNPQPGDVAVYGTDHVNLVTTAGGGRRVGGNQSNNVTAGPYSGGTIFRPNWAAAGFASGGLVSIADILAQDRKEDERAGLHPLLRGVQEVAGLASGGLASGWTVVGEEGPELARFDDPARIYSTQESARMLATAGAATAQGGAGASTGPLVGEYHQHLHDAQATVREAMAELTHTLRVVDTGGLYG